MSTTARTFAEMTAAEFLATDQAEFGNAWRYELDDGVIVAHASPSPEHGAILSMLNVAIETRLRTRGRGGCRFESGSGAAPKMQQRATAKIPDGTVRCGQHPRVTFDIVSPSELKNIQKRDRRRLHLQDIEGVQEVVEIYQHVPAVHVYRRQEDGGWEFVPVNGLEADLEIKSINMSIPLAEIYESVTLGPDDQDTDDEA
jgi:Uma2 family endonuclease